MEIEYSNEVRGKVHAFRFTSYEMEVIVRRIKPEIAYIDRQIEKINNHPKNEGQATWSCKIREWRIKREMLEEIVKGFEHLY